jgi:hypothetical protein
LGSRSRIGIWVGIEIEDRYLMGRDMNITIGLRMGIGIKDQGWKLESKVKIENRNQDSDKDGRSGSRSKMVIGIEDKIKNGDRNRGSRSK